MRLHHLLVLLAVSCSSTPGDPVDAGLDELRGNPEILPAAAEILEPRARELAQVRYIQARCVRTEFIPGNPDPVVDEGTLLVRREPACVILHVEGEKPRTVREDATTRIVIRPEERRATRWTFQHNARGPLAVASLLVDLEALTGSLAVAACEPSPDDGPAAQRVVFVPRMGKAPASIRQLELVFLPGSSVPRRIVVQSSGGGSLHYEILRPTLDPAWRDPARRFTSAIPAGFWVREREG